MTVCYTSDNYIKRSAIVAQSRREVVTHLCSSIGAVADYLAGENVAAIAVWIDSGETAVTAVQRRRGNSLNPKTKIDIACAVRGDRSIYEDGVVVCSCIGGVSRYRGIED